MYNCEKDVLEKLSTRNVNKAKLDIFMSNFKKNLNIKNFYKILLDNRCNNISEKDFAEYMEMLSNIQFYIFNEYVMIQSILNRYDANAIFESAWVANRLEFHHRITKQSAIAAVKRCQRRLAQTGNFDMMNFMCKYSKYINLYTLDLLYEQDASVLNELFEILVEYLDEYFSDDHNRPFGYSESLYSREELIRMHLNENVLKYLLCRPTTREFIEHTLDKIMEFVHWGEYEECMEFLKIDDK